MNGLSPLRLSRDRARWGRLALCLVWLALAVGCAPAARYERRPVPSTPFTGPKLELNQRLCAEQGKTLQCRTTPRNTQDCWCDPR